MAQEIVFIRHSSLAVPRGMCYGFSDIDVSPNFSIEAEWLKLKLASFEPQIVISSPLKRCFKLSEEVFNKPVKLENDLREVNYGTWEGRMWEDIDVEDNNLWMYKNINNCPPNGESFSQLQTRVINVLNKVKALEQDRVAVVCHGGVIRSLLAHLLSTPLENTRIFDIHYVGFVKFVKNNEGWRLTELNAGFKQ